MITDERHLVPLKDATRYTLKLIGKAIKDGAEYLPIRNYAAALATTAEHKDYLGQAKAVWNHFLKNWRYVLDPVDKELVVTGPEALYNLVLGHNGGVGLGKGAGDCDDATAALGAGFRSIGFPVRLGTVTPPHGNPFFNHVFLQYQVPNVGWITVDPVLHPQMGLGDIAPHSQIAFWNLEGDLIASRGISPKQIKAVYGDGKGERMRNFQQLHMGFLGVEDANTGMNPLYPWDQEVLQFGQYADQLGYIPDASSLMVEVNEADELQEGWVRTPMLEVAPDDYSYIKSHGKPYNGCTAVSDIGQVYEWDDMGALFSLFGQAPKRRRRRRRRRGKKSAVRTAAPPSRTAKVASKSVKAKLPKIIKTIPTGALVKIKDTPITAAMKAVKPIIESVDYWARKLAPVAAILPGSGPSIRKLIKLPKVKKVKKKKIKKPTTLTKIGKKKKLTKKQISTRRKSAIARRKAREKKEAEAIRARAKRAAAIRRAMQAQTGAKAGVIRRI